MASLWLTGGTGERQEHGSRFSAAGALLQRPATNDLGPA